MKNTLTILAASAISALVASVVTRIQMPNDIDCAEFHECVDIARSQTEALQHTLQRIQWQLEWLDDANF